MYGHLKGLSRMGDGGADIPSGSSMGVDRGRPLNAPPVAATGWGAKGGDLLKSAPSAIAQAAIDNSLKTTAKAVGSANVHGFASKAGGSALHTGASSFTHAKGVVNTVGGARDITRAEKAEDARLPPKGERKAQIMGFATLDAHTAEGKAKREAAEKRIAAAGKGGGGNLGGGVAIHTLGGGKADRPSARYGGLLPTMGTAPTREVRASRVVSSSSSSSGGGGGGGGAPAGVSRVLGGGSSAANGASGSAQSDSERRAAFFEKKLLEAKSKVADA